MKKFKELLESDVITDVAKKIGEKNERGRLILARQRKKEEITKKISALHREIEKLQNELRQEYEKS